MSQFESLTNELLFDIFEFLHTAHLLHGFIDLNSRFNHLLYLHFQNHQFNLQSISKKDFDIICQEQLSILKDNITSLRLSDDDETPNLSKLLFTHSFTLDRFIYLKSLSLYHIDYFDIFNQCHNLSCLQNLYLIDCKIDKQQKKLIDIINNIWSIPNLIHCVINNLIVNMTWIYKVSSISLTLEYVSIKIIEGDISALYYLCKSIPCLQQLNIDVIYWSCYNQPKILFSYLISLKTSFQYQVYSITEFLKNLPNLFDSFRTHFWIEERQWYIRCDYYLSKKHDIGILYTLPYAFDRYSYLNPSYSISTKPDQDEFYSHYHVKYVNDLQNTSIDLFKNLKLSNIRFPNIQHFEIIFPLNDDFGLSSLSFNRLTSLTVRLNNTFGYEQLQVLINQANQFYSLELTSFEGSIERLFKLASSSIRRLDLSKAQLKHGLFFNYEHCIDLTNSFLGRQCEVLRVELENENDILILIEKMSYLRVLAFQLKTHIFLFDYTIFQSEQKKLIRWLKKNYYQNV